jgi:hypothetical protein
MTDDDEHCLSRADTTIQAAVKYVRYIACFTQAIGNICQWACHSAAWTDALLLLLLLLLSLLQVWC